MKVLVWHRHGSWLTALLQGPHRYLLPRVGDGEPDGLGRARTWTWPESAVEVSPGRLRDAEIDVVVLQGARDALLTEAWTGRRPGRDLPAVWVEHDTPPTVTTRHPAETLPGVVLVHVTPFNAVAWDNGRAPTRVVEHAVVDPGERWTGELARTAVVCNDPVRRGRLVGTDLIPDFAGLGDGLDVFGMRVTPLRGDRVAVHEDLPQARLHAELARRRVYLHLTRWTSLGLSLVEAMALGMPVVVLATTEAPRVVPPEAGAVSTDPDELRAGAERLLRDPEAAALAGKVARRTALERFGLARFLAEWDDVLGEAVA